MGHLFELYFRDYCCEAGEAVESEGLPLGLGRRITNAAMAAMMMPIMMKTKTGLAKHVRLPGGLEGRAMDSWMREWGALGGRSQKDGLLWKRCSSLIEHMRKIKGFMRNNNFIDNGIYSDLNW